MNINKTAIIEYLHTIIKALLIALILAGIATACSKVIAEHHSRMLAKISNTAKDNEIILYLIDKYTEMANKNPGNYSYNVKLGNLYELVFNYHEAEAQYKKAINKSPYGVYSSYLGLANLYIKQGKHKEALNIVKQLKNTDHKPLLLAKGDFYMNLGDVLWQKQNYDDAVTQYKIAFFYYKKVDSKKKSIAITSILDCYNKIADIYYEQNKIDKAIQSLDTALLYKETPIILYKLALLYKDYDPLAANKYMEKTYKLDPGLINFDIYEEILFNLVKMYYIKGQDIETDLYKHKLKAIKDFQKRYVITEKDVTVDIIKYGLKKNLFKTKNTAYVKFKIDNTSKYDFNKLYLIVKLRHDNGSKTVFEKKLFSKKNPLKSRTASDTYKIEYKFSDKDEVFLSKELYFDFYAGKKENMRKIPVYSLEIKQ